MAQRLVRRLDDATKIPYTPSQEETDHIHRILDTLPENLEKPDLASFQLYKPGSSNENPYGFKGQVALREQFTVGKEVRDLLTSKQGLSTQEIEAAAIAGGMTTMLHDGILKVLRGETTLNEVYRVVG